MKMLWTYSSLEPITVHHKHQHSLPPLPKYHFYILLNLDSIYKVHNFSFIIPFTNFNLHYIRAPSFFLPPSVPASFPTLTPEFLSGRLDAIWYMGPREMHPAA